MKRVNTLWRTLWRTFNRLPEWIRLSLVAFVALIFFVLGGTIAWATFMPIPAINAFESRSISESTKIFDRTGNIVLYDVHGSVRRTSVLLESISPYIQKATIAIEDAEFYDHHGFRPMSFMRAALEDIMTGSFSQGGSTITQQVVKNALLTQKKTISRKIQEIILALRLERVYSKDQILNTYLNENPYGGTIYGVQEASQYFFGIDAKDVDIAQAAYLAALPQAPTYYSPYGNHRDALDRRKNLVLTKMLEHEFITEDEYDEAKNEIVQFKDESEAGIKAPHFVFFVREYLESKYGVDAVMKGGLRVVTTLDYDLQKMAEESVAEYSAKMQASFNATNEGIVAIEPSTGQILAMVGSRGYFDDTIDGKVNVTLSRRQPGSSFKPFVYATAFEKGYTPDTIVFDLPTQFSTACAPSDNLNDAPPCYSPSNFDGTFKGPIKLRDALAISENIPAVKTLYLAGIQDSIATARSLGITTLADAERYGLTLVLGGGEVTLLEMTSAYGVFANDGVRNPSTGILRVEDKSGTVMESYENTATRVLDQQIARLMNEVLSDNVARIPEFGADSPLNFPGYDVADKTGTTNDFRDVWILGYTPGIAVGAWAGNNDNSPMVKKIAAFIIAPMWHDFMEKALEKYPSEGFVPAAPDPELDSLPPVLRGNWNSDPSRGTHDILYWVNKNNPRGGPPTNPWADSQFAYWEYPVQLWVTGQAMGTSSITTIIPPPAQDQARFIINAPAAGATILVNTPTTVLASHPQPQNVAQVTYFLNGQPIGASTQSPYAITFVPTFPGQVTLTAVAQTPQGLETAATFFTIQ